MYLIHRAMTPPRPPFFFFPFRDIILQSTPTDDPSALSNLYILTGHENSYWENFFNYIVFFLVFFFFKSRCGKTRTTNPCGSLQYEWWCQCDMQPHSYGHTVKHWEWLVEMLLEWGLLLLVLLLGNYRFTAVITVRVSKVKRKRSDTCVWKSFTSVWPGEICEKNVTPDSCGGRIIKTKTTAECH